MANIKSVEKRARQSLKLHDRNASVISSLKTARKKALKAVAGGDAKEAVAAAVGAFISGADKAAKRGIIHKNAANRRKSRMAKVLAGSKPAEASVSA